MATCSSCGNNTTKCGCKDTPLTTPPSYTCPPNDSCPDPTPCFETIQDTCVIHSLNYGLPCLGVTAGMTLEQILQILSNTLNSIGDGTLSTSDEGVLVEAETTAMNFVGPLVNVVSSGANSVTVNVNGDLVADLDDVNQNGFSTLLNLFNDTTFDFLASPPSFATYANWVADIVTNTVNSQLYSLVYDPVDNIWRPINLSFLVNEVVCTFYSQNGFLSGARTVGFNGQNLTFTNDSVTNCKGASGSGGGSFIVKSSTIGSETGNPQVFYTAGHQRINHLRVYNDGYQSYASWIAAANPNATVEQRRLFVGFFSDAYNENAFQEAGYQRTPSDTEVSFFSNPTSVNNASDAFNFDARILKTQDEYNVIDQATRVITGGGDLIIQRLSPTSQHATIGDDVGLGSIILMHGSSIIADPNAEFDYTGQWTWNKYGIGTFTGTPTYILGTTSSGDIIELTSTELQQELLTGVQFFSADNVLVNSTYNGKILGINHPTAITLDIVLNSSLAIPIGTRIEVHQTGAGVITITPVVGVTVNSRGGLLSSNGQYAKFELIKLQTNQWLASGDLA